MKILQEKVTVNKQVLRTREWVFSSLLILLDTIPYDDIKVTNITDKAGIARQTFYRNYKSKDDIIIKYLDDIFDEFKSKAKEVQNDGYNATYILSFQLFMQHKDALIKIKNAGLDYLLFNQLWSYNNYFLNNISEDKSKNNIDLYNEFSVKFQIGGLATIILEWIKTDMSIPPEEMGNMIYEITKRFKDQDGYLPDIIDKVKNPK